MENTVTFLRAKSFAVVSVIIVNIANISLTDFFYLFDSLYHLGVAQIFLAVPMAVSYGKKYPFFLLINLLAVLRSHLNIRFKL